MKARPDPEPDKTHLQPPTPTGTHQEPQWNEHTLPSQGPHSFENPVFQDHPGSHELTETTYPSEEIYDGHQLPPGKKANCKNNPNFKSNVKLLFNKLNNSY